MKDWQEIIKLYEKDNVYMGEAAQIINRNVSFEVPSLKKQLAKMDNMVDDLRKQQQDCIKRSNQLKAEYSSGIQRLGIKGEDPERELLSQLGQLPSLLQSLHKNIVSLGNVIDYYRNVVSLTSDSKRSVCPTISYLKEKGNTTFYEFVNGVKPDVIETPQFSNSRASVQEAEDVIDFGDDTIDFGDVENGSSSTGTGTGSNSDGFVHIHESQISKESSRKESVEDIDWGDDVPTESTVEASGAHIARGVEALSILEHRKTRDSVIHELKELECFLLQRLFESQQPESGFVEMMMASLLTSLQEEDVSAMLHQVQAVSEEMMNDRLKTLYQMKDNEKFIEKTVKKLRLKTDLSEKALLKSVLLQQKEQEVIGEKQSLYQQIPLLVNATRDLEESLEQAISSKYKNRPVNIMAGSRVL